VRVLRKSWLYNPRAGLDFLWNGRK
jgi:hypothetical protein